MPCRHIVLAAIASLISAPFASADEPVNTSGGVQFRTQRLTVDANEGIDVADIDQDGKLDVVSGRSWYRAPDFHPRPLRNIDDWNGYVTSNGDFAHDVNQDGLPDVIAGGFLETELAWYENPGKEGLELGQQWKRHLLVDTQLSQNEGAMFVDIDQDGVPELLVNSWNRTNPLCAWKLTTREVEETVKQKKDGKTVEKTVTRTVPAMDRWVIGQRANGHGMAVGDLNNDGRVDIMVGEGWYEQPAENADSQPWIYHADWTNLHAAIPCVVVDVNEDGINDLIWAKGHDYGLYWWEMKGHQEDGTLAWTEHKIDSEFSQAHALELADLDGDGEKELITGKRFRAHNGRDPGGKDPVGMYYYKWDPKTTKFTRYDIKTDVPVGIGLQIRIVDFNGDGRLDIAVAGKSGTHILFNEGVK